MPALMPKRPSTVLGEIRRELDPRSKLAAVAKGRIMKQSSAPSPIPKAAAGAVLQNRPAPIAPKQGIIKRPYLSTPRPRPPAISYLPLEEAPKRFTAPKGRPTPFAMNGSGVASRGIEKPSLPMPQKPSEAAATKEPFVQMPRKPAEAAATKKSSVPTPPPRPSSAGLETIQKGTRVCVRTPMETIKKPFLSTPRPRQPAISYLPLEEAPRRFTAPKGRPTPFAMNGSGVASAGIQKSSLPMPQKPSEAAASKKPFLPTPQKPAESVATKESFVPVSRSTPPARPSSAGLEPIQKGTRVCVRTPMGTLPTGMRLFIWLSAVVVSDAEEGSFKVKYNGNFPRDDPSRDVRVARDQVKIMPSSPRWY